MNLIAKLFLLCWYSTQISISSAFVVHKNNHKSPSLAFSRPNAPNSLQLASTKSSDIATLVKPPSTRTTVDKIVQTSNESLFRAQGILGISTATAIASYLLIWNPHHHPDYHNILTHGTTAATHIGINLWNNLWGSYQTMLAENPIATKAGTSATVYSIGDIIAQKASANDDDDEKIDLARVLRSGLAGGIGHGPLSHVWYNLSEEFFSHVLHLVSWWSFVPKIVVDQTVWGPIWNSSYILLIGFMKQEDSLEKMVDDVKETTFPLFLDGLKLWPLAHVVTYGLIPVEDRLLWVDLIEILWVSILAQKTSSLSD